jgi:hypothetical protein
MIQSNIKNNILGFEDFQNKYRDEWRKGNISENSVNELLYILSNIDINNSICKKIFWTVQDIIPLLIKYRFKKNQSYKLIEPIRMDNWSLHTWISIDPSIVEYGCSKTTIYGGVCEGFRLTYGDDNYADIAGDELMDRLTEEFTLKNLSNIDYIENYLKTYAKTDKIRRYLQLI